MNILFNFSFMFTKPSFENFVTLTIGAILANGSRTIANILRASRPMITKHFTTYHRFLSRARLNLFSCSKVLCEMLFSLLPETIELVVDETISRHYGAKVFGKSAHRDTVRSTRGKKHITFGHQWVVVGVQFMIPFAHRPWALPIIALLWLSEKNCHKEHIKHRTPVELTIVMLRLLHHWFPRKRFIITGDGAYASIVLARFCHTHQWVQAVSRLRMDARLYDYPPQQKSPKGGRPARKGKRLLSPREEIDNPRNQWRKVTIAWYGNQQKEIQYIYKRALIHKPNYAPVEIAWVLINDLTLYSYEAFFTTDRALPPETIIQFYVHRLSIEVTFQETKGLLALESTRSRKKQSVIRSFPLLLGLFSVISLWYSQTFTKHSPHISQESWYHKNEPTFSDALYMIRYDIWHKSIFHMSIKNNDTIKLSVPFVKFITNYLARAA
jgi:hypothetical protein